MRRSRALVALGIVAGLLMGAPTPGATETNPYERGPAPTAASVASREGPLPYAQVRITGSTAIGFERGTVSYPDDTGTYAVVVAVPGLVWPESAVAWVGPYLASNGFVVMTLDPFSSLDGPTSRAAQLDAAVGWLTTASPHAVRSRVDADRIGFIGQGFGGAATVEAADDGPDASPRVAVDLGPVTLGPDFADHSGVEAGTLSWLKRHLDDDVRYDPFTCPSGDGASSGGTGVGVYPSTCAA